jgi:ParB family chromosome partitioning protein
MRRSFEPEGLEALVASIREHGVLQPVVVRPRDDGFELVAGERRWRAAVAAGLGSIPASVRELSDRDAAVWGMVENLQRADLQFFDEAEGYRRLMDEFRLSQEQVAVQVGRSQPAIANKLRLLRLEGLVRQRVIESGLSERHARVLLRLEGLEARLGAVAAFREGGFSVRQAEAWVARRVAGGEAGERVERGGGTGDYPRAVASALRGFQRAGFAVVVEAGPGGREWVIRVQDTRT